MISCPGLSRARTASTARTTYERSGSRVLRSGVGTQMSIASMSWRRAMSVVAEGLPDFEGGGSHVRRGGELARLRGGGDVFAAHVADVAFPSVDRVDLGDVDVEPGDFE